MDTGLEADTGARELRFRKHPRAEVEAMLAKLEELQQMNAAATSYEQALYPLKAGG